VKVLDFGVAQSSARVDTDAGAVRGTYAYMGPEQVRGKPLDKRADVFAVGVILYELTTGRRLFRGSDVEIMTSIVERDVTPPSQHVPNYPQELEKLVLQALQRDRSRRTASAGHLAMALDQFCMQRSLVTGPLVVAQYVRSVYPYERAHEKGMGIVQNDAVNAAALEAKLLADELRALRDPARRRAMPEGDVEEVSVDELIVEEEEDLPTTPQDQDAAANLADRLGLDAFDEDSDVKPVVLLSPKRKGNERKSDGAFMSDLERRLLEDGSANDAANGGGRNLEADEENVGS
jgi:serine/threonine-protein kinase